MEKEEIYLLLPEGLSEDMKGKYRAWFRRHERKIESLFQKTWQENKEPDSENMKWKYRAWFRRHNRKKIIKKENKKKNNFIYVIKGNKEPNSVDMKGK